MGLHDIMPAPHQSAIALLASPWLSLFMTLLGKYARRVHIGDGDLR
jgi:hypothetical protein